MGLWVAGVGAIVPISGEERWRSVTLPAELPRFELEGPLESSGAIPFYW